ncbi:MAG: FecCD family ABC transporter permease [Acidilobus sp.]
MRERLGTLVLAFSLPITVLLSLSVGPYKSVGPLTLIELLLGHLNSQVDVSVIEYRAVRTAAALVLGAGLAAAGSTLQFTLRNPLADPYLTGMASGSLLGVTAALAAGKASFWALYASALLGGLLTLLLVVVISGLVGGGATTLLVTGVALSYALSGVTMFLMISLGPRLPGALYWMFGSVAFVTLPLLLRTLAIVAAAMLGLAIMSRSINALLLGDDVARAIGVKVRAVRLTAFTLASLITASLVAMAGPVGFVGLAAPWLSKRAFGVRFAVTLSTSAIVGAELTTLSDVIARMIIFPSEAPLTAVTSVFGAPLLVYILLGSRGE